MGQGCVNSFRPFCSSQACTPSSARDIWRVYQSGTSMTLFFCLPVTCLSAPWFPRLPKQDCNHKLVEPLNFSVCCHSDCYLTVGRAYFAFCLESCQPPPAVKLLVIHTLPCHVRTTTSSDRRKKGELSVAHLPQISRGISWSSVVFHE